METPGVWATHPQLLPCPQNRRVQDLGRSFSNNPDPQHSAVIAFPTLLLMFGHEVVSSSLWPHGLQSPLGSSVLGISQAQILEWAPISSSRRSSRLRDQPHVSCIGRQILHHRTTWGHFLPHNSTQLTLTFKWHRHPQQQKHCGWGCTWVYLGTKRTQVRWCPRGSWILVILMYLAFYSFFLITISENDCFAGIWPFWEHQLHSEICHIRL